MSKITLQGDVNGTGTVTLAAPNTNTNRTLNLPDAAGTLLESNNPVVSQLNGGQLAGMRNKIINGKMEIAQRGGRVLRRLPAGPTRLIGGVQTIRLQP